MGLLLLVGVGLTAAATAAAGPIGFVALAAPHLARRLTGAPGAGLLAAGLMGGALLLVSDLAAERLIAGVQLPVGVMTGAIGGIYLIWLLASQWRAGRAS
uniref:iron chelate uptake ABC transporter family permease subunit n=1 Tax=Fodinicola feengrottensis TaxID=435914 RepID=UPI0036F26B0D